MSAEDPPSIRSRSSSAARGRRKALVVCAAAALMALALAATATPTTSALAAASPSPGATGQAVGPGLPNVQLPTLDPQKVIYQAIAGVLFTFDQTLIGEMEGVWNPMVAGADDLTGKQNFGPGLVIDNSRLRGLWGLSFGIATGALLVLIFTLTVVVWLLGAAVGSKHDILRNLVYFLFAVILMGASFFLVSQLVTVDNVLVQAVNGQVSVELRSLPSFQGIGLKDPSAIQDVHDLLKAITVLLVIVVVALELVVLFVIYFVRLILIWVLVVAAPFVVAFSIIPAGRGLVVYWARLLIAAVALKFVNVLVFTTFVTMGAVSDVALLNVILVATMLIFMITVPATLLRALGEPSVAVISAQNTWREVTHHEPLRRASTNLWGRLRGG